MDDGKSTLVGRLLYDSRAVYDDHVRSVEAASRNRTAGPIDFSLFTDGLRAEREQGITIDVAYRYFATRRRKFILADTPGHEQYTRNMATGASTADVAVLLVDARHGVRPQSIRHARIARLLGISKFALAVNKMDLVDFDADVYWSIRHDLDQVLGGADLHAIPISALHGDNVTAASPRTPWFDGPSLLEYLETVDVDADAASKPLRFPVQLTLRPHDRFRGYAGQVVSGTVRPGDLVAVHPSGRTSTVRRIVTWDGDLDIAHATMSVTLVLDDELDVSRGDLIVRADPAGLDMPSTSSSFEAEIVWMDERPLDPARVYLLKHGTRTVVTEVDRALRLNDIGETTVRTTRPLVFDRYRDNRATGSFILIDPATNFTAGAGMIINPIDRAAPARSRSGAAERLARLVRAASSDDEAAHIVRRALEEMLV